MPLPPFANLFAVHDTDPATLDTILRDLQQSQEFAEVWRPAPGWVVAVVPLPETAPDGEAARQQQLVFAEGRDVLLDGAGTAPAARCRALAELTDIHPERLGALPGDFGFLRFRPDGGATVVRSCGGLVLFYLRQAGPRWAIATRLGDVVRYLPDEPRLDPLVNAIWATSWCMFPDGRTFLAGVTLLEQGCFARFEGDRPVHVGRYWHPRPPHVPWPTPARAQEHAEHLRALLIAKLKRDLDPTGGNLLTLSGGVDSSSLAALAAGVVGRPVWTWSLLPAREDLLQHALSYIEPLAQRYGFARRWTVLFHAPLVLDLWRAAPRIVFHVIHPALCSLPGVVQEAPVRVLFGGEFADEVCGSGYTLPDLWAQMPLLRLLTEVRRRAREPRDVARWAKHRLAACLGRPTLPFPRALLSTHPQTGIPWDFFHRQVQEDYRAWYARQRQAVRDDPAPWRYLAVRSTALAGFVPMNWEACSALGIRRSLPFFNREVLELAFACHPTELYGPGPKKLLRHALRADVPEHNLQRPDKGGWGRHYQEAYPVARAPAGGGAAGGSGGRRGSGVARPVAAGGGLLAVALSDPAGDLWGCPAGAAAGIALSRDLVGLLGLTIAPQRTAALAPVQGTMIRMPLSTSAGGERRPPGTDLRLRQSCR